MITKGKFKGLMACLVVESEKCQWLILEKLCDDNKSKNSSDFPTMFNPSILKRYSF